MKTRGEQMMKAIGLGILTMLLAMPLHAQGLTVTMKEIGPVGQTAPTLQFDATHARLDIPSLASQVIYDASTRTLRLMVPLVKSYREYTPASVQSAAAARGAQSSTPITYKRTGTSKVKDWTCTTYEGFRGTEKVAEVCAAEGSAIGLTAADFALARQAMDMMKGITSAEQLERIPVYGTVQSQGFAGFPVRRVTFRNGKADTTTELVEIKREAIPAATFALPAGYNKMP
jgi:hypothetical protein